MQTIVEAMHKLAEIEASISFELNGKTHRVEHAYPFMPSGRLGQIDPPCWINEANFIRATMANGYRTTFYTVRPSLILGPLGEDLQARTELAWHYHQAFLDAMGQAVTLGWGNALQSLRGNGEESGTVVVLPWNEVNHVALDYLMDLQLHDEFEARA